MASEIVESCEDSAIAIAIAESTTFEAETKQRYIASYSTNR